MKPLMPKKTELTHNRVQIPAQQLPGGGFPGYRGHALTLYARRFARGGQRGTAQVAGSANRYEADAWIGDIGSAGGNPPAYCLERRNMENKPYCTTRSTDCHRTFFNYTRPQCCEQKKKETRQAAKSIMQLEADWHAARKAGEARRGDMTPGRYQLPIVVA